MKFFESFSGNKRKKEAEPIKLLPYSVRYALQYGESLLKKEEIEDLARNGFGREAFYLTAKSLVGDREAHRAFVQEFADTVMGEGFTKDTERASLQKVVEKRLGETKDIEVQGDKLAQISRQGFDMWQDKFKETAQSLSRENKEVFLVAHAMFTGLDSFLKEFAAQNKTLNILVPVWFEGENFGYSIFFNNGKARVEWLDVGSTSGEVVVLDDTANTGETSKKILEFLKDKNIPEVEFRAIDQNK